MPSAVTWDQGLVGAVNSLVGGMMDEITETLILFYQIASNDEWKRIMGSKPPDEILPDDFAHCEFCTAVVRTIFLKLLQATLENKCSASRYWSAIRLYDYWRIEKKFRFNFN